MLSLNRKYARVYGEANGRELAGPALVKNQGAGGAPARPVALINDFFTQLTDPTMVPAFLAGGMAYRLVRFGAAGKWVTAPAVKTFTGLFARQLGASTLALGAEAAVFTGAHRAALSLAPSHPALHASFSHETAGTALMLGSLRSFAFGTGILGGMLQRAGLAGAASPVLLSQLGAYAGLLTSQTLEHALLYPEAPAPEHPWLQAAVSLIHFNGFNALARRITPKVWGGMEHRLEQRTLEMIREKGERIREGFGHELGGPDLAWKTVGWSTEIPGISKVDPKREGLNFMFGKRPSTRIQPALATEQFLERHSPRTQFHIKQIDYALDSVEQPFLKTLSQTQIADREVVDLATRRLHNVIYFSNPHSAKSTFLNWIINLGFRRIVEKRDAKALDQLMTMITRPTTLDNLENFLARQLYKTRLPEPLMGIISPKFKKNSDYFDTIEEMPLSREARKTLWLLLIAQKKGREGAPFYINPHKLFSRMKDFYQMYDEPKWKLLESILEKTPSSPLGILRLLRLYHVLYSEMVSENSVDIAYPRGLLGSKLRELANDKYGTSGVMPEALSGNDSEIYLGPQGGFLGKFGPWELYRNLAPKIPELIDPVKESQRREKAHGVLAGLLKRYPGEAAFKPEVIAEAYFLLSQAFRGSNYEYKRGSEYGDFSYHMALAIQKGELAIEAHSLKEYTDRFNDLSLRIAAARKKAYQLPTKLPDGNLFHYPQGKIPGLETPLILLHRPQIGSKDFEGFLQDYKKMLGIGIHEGGHFFEREKFPQGGKNEGTHAKEETTTETAHIFWQAQHGNAETLRDYLMDSPTGFITRVLDWFEDNYREDAHP